MAKAKKQSIEPSLGDRFNLKMLLWGDPGCGKTTFVGTYTKGPIHFYLADPQGLSVLRKNNNRESITSDVFTDETYGRGKTYPAFWKQLQKDEREGFFGELAEQEGILVIDSWTTMEGYLVDYVCSTVLKKKVGDGGAYDIGRPDWPTISGYVLAFFKHITSLPCATLILCHSKSTQDADNNVFFRPTILGQQADSAPRWFSEYLRLSLAAGHLKVQVQGNPRIPAASRLFLPGDGVKTLQDPTMDTLYNVFHGGNLDCKAL